MGRAVPRYSAELSTTKTPLLKSSSPFRVTRRVALIDHRSLLHPVRDFSTDFIFLLLVNVFVTSDIAFTLYLDYNLHSLTASVQASSTVDP